MDSASDPGVVLRGPAPPVRLRPSLIHDGEHVRIGEGLVLGSDADADLRLDPALAVGRHAVVRITASGTPIVDDLSGIGLLVNDDVVRDQSHVLRSGDRITIGGEPLYVTDGTEGLLTAIGERLEQRRLLTIGSDPECDVVLDHPAVSPLHAVVEHKNGGAFVRDHGGRGTLLVEGRQRGFAAIEAGAELGVGPFRLLFDGASVITRDAGRVRLAASDVSQLAGGRMILQPTTLSVSTAEMVALVGPSGAGKSTLLRLLAATAVPHSGAVALGGEPIGLRRADIGYVPQDEIVHRELTVVEALRYAAALRLPAGVGREGVERAVEAIVSELGLSEHGGTRIGDLSGGQRKRVGLATELVHRPLALLLDEPTTGLDPGLERRTMQLLRRLTNESRAVILVTHATRSLELCDKLLVLAPGGHTAFYGSPTEALAFFAVEQLDEIYDGLSEERGPELGALFQASEQFAHQRADALLGTMAVQPDSPPAPKARLGRGRETTILVSRYLRVFSRDRRSLALLVGQAPLLGILAALMFKAGALSNADRARDATNLIFLLITMATWMGAISASREIVRERAQLMRETSIGVRLSSYLSSKMLILGTLATAQVVLMSTAALLVRTPDGGAADVLGLVYGLLLAGLVSVPLGLIISAYATTENQANSLIPLALIPQLLLGGAIVAVATMSAPMKAAAGLIFTRWAFAGAGSAYGLESRIAADPKFSRVQEYGSAFFDLSLPALTLIALCFAAVSLGVTAYLIRRGEVRSGVRT